MPPADRATGRNVHIWDVHQPGVSLGGLRLTHGTGTTRSVFRRMLDIIISDHSSYRVTHRESGMQVDRGDNQILAEGNYDLESEDELAKLVLSTETISTRAFSRSLSPRDTSFTRTVRDRDRMSVIGDFQLDEEMIASNDWTGFEAAHIFPLAFESDISTAFETGPAYEAYRASTGDIGYLSTGINSPRNGLLLMSAYHQLWDSYAISVSPDHNYQVICFTKNPFNLEGTLLSEVCRRPGDPRAVSDGLLRWHFRQAVLTNMRAAGEPVFEHDFPPGSDMIGEILKAPGAAKRMEFELATRLSGFCLNGDMFSEIKIEKFNCA